jgi:hypothetical protein
MHNAVVPGANTSTRRQYAFVKGDHIGVLLDLDLDAGWLRFYRNGERYGPGFTEGVTGPLKRAVQLHGGMGSQVAVVPSVEVPCRGCRRADSCIHR